MMTLFFDLLKINWLATINFCEKVLSRPVLLLQPYDKSWFAARNIWDDETLAIKSWFTVFSML